MHTAMIKRIAVDAAERYLLTASDYKTARVWDLATGKLLQILRPPLGEGNEGKLYAAALSPDGREARGGRL
ncbi:MAG: WD40 repeat domain-containing protein [Methylococcales bacterium]